MYIGFRNHRNSSEYITRHSLRSLYNRSSIHSLGPPKWDRPPDGQKPRLSGITKGFLKAFFFQEPLETTVKKTSKVGPLNLQRKGNLMSPKSRQRVQFPANGLLLEKQAAGVEVLLFWVKVLDLDPKGPKHTILIDSPKRKQWLLA